MPDPSGSPTSWARAGLGVGPDRRAGLLERGRLAQQPQRLGVHGVVGDRAGGQDLAQPDRVGIGVVAGERVEHRQRRYALAQVGAGGLAGLRRLGGDVEQVVGELERDADRLAVIARAPRLCAGAAPPNMPPNRADVAISDPVLSARTCR